MKYASVCSGVEAASLAWMGLGWEPVWFSEIEPFPCAVLSRRFGASRPQQMPDPAEFELDSDEWDIVMECKKASPENWRKQINPDLLKKYDEWSLRINWINQNNKLPETGTIPNLGDMTQINGEKYYGTVDLLVGGTPCQGFSVAGKRKGLEDPRSGLARKYIELLETMQPRWFVWENVPGVLSANGGRDFAEFISEAQRVGYSVGWRILDAQYVRVDGYPRAVPQRRRRVFAVGHLGADWRYPASVLFEPGSLFGNTPPCRKAGAGVARSVTASTGGASGKEQQLDFVGNGKPLNAIESGKGENRQSRPSNIVCMATGQGNAEKMENCGVNLTCNHKSPIVAGFMGGQGSKAGGIAYSDGVSPTIKAGQSGTNTIPDVICVHDSQDPITNTEHANAVNRNMGLENCVCQYGEIAGTLNARHDSIPCADRGMNVVYENHMQDSRVRECGGCSPQINAKAGTGGGNLPLVQNSMSVRRLTPVECERLMGFPDNWTRIQWNGKSEDGCPDSLRYKSCGNSMCVNVIRWIGMQIQLVENKNRSVDDGTLENRIRK